jgi:predicted Zn-dependent protease with MMP-like domain
MMRSFEKPPGVRDIERFAARALREIPASLRRHTAGTLIRIEDLADDATARDLGLDSPFDLLGLYVGRPMTTRGAADADADIDTIFLFRRPILDYWCETGEDLYVVIRHVLIHEIAHHFGFSDDDIARIEAEDEDDRG